MVRCNKGLYYFPPPRLGENVKDQNIQSLVILYLITSWQHKDQVSSAPDIWSKKKAKSLCLTNYALRHEGVCGSGFIDPHFLDLGTSWRWMVSFTPLPLYPQGKSLRYPLDRRLGGSQSPVGTVTGYGLHDQEVGVRVPVWLRIFPSPCPPNRLWVSTSLLSSGYMELFPRG
jgi:hypothetical protein